MGKDLIIYVFNIHTVCTYQNLHSVFLSFDYFYVIIWEVDLYYFVYQFILILAKHGYPAMGVNKLDELLI